ncbi:MAG TPA: class II aldolase/adducin family protein [Acetobacteraceae bacterium]|nr:class II aldolase/adducin family protein [Acetobacteraceae bacterium]
MDQEIPDPAQTAKRTLIEAGAILARAGQGDMTRGHVSVRVPGSPELFFMKPHSVGLDELTAENLLTIDLDGGVVAGSSRRHSEVFIHSEIYRARQDVGAVVHVHPTHVVAFSATGRALRPLSQGGALFAGGLPSFTATMDLIRSPETGRAVAEALGQHQAVLMRAHGLAMTGRSIEEAVVGCIMLEEAARVQLLAEAAGIVVPDFPADDVARLRRNLMNPDQHLVNFAYLARAAGMRPPLAG